jgi:hypothetical protein
MECLKFIAMKQLQLAFIAVFIFFLFPVHAQIITANQKTPSLTCVDFFKTDKVSELTLLSDFKNLRSKKKVGVYQNAVATLYINATDSITENAEISARGAFRRELCQMPSLMINFKTKTPSILGGLKKMKVVCGCSSSPYNERLVLMEYLTYKIYNLLTDLSFKAKLLKVNYKDVNDKMKPYSQYAFFIEDVDEMAKRNGCREYKGKVANSILSDRNQMTMVTIFQYMIGNTDWSVPNYHNIKLIQLKKDSTSYPYTVPYDFDFAGIVNASYAFPNKDLFDIEKVTDRLYRGFPRTMEELEKTLQIFRDKKEEILSMVLKFDLLDLKDRKTMIDYIEDFYKIINDSKRVKYEFVNNARQN